eukprot:CAMPEP_0170481396 /NCGR_PEP_ID=MMETSP0208-20121228/1853_1 /TAXON_ID=197538 /ORGANISM="Strombidium inclinatum, Strain S3" /LENGTH=44 /DNA_ID= /DNA_START= /DNA_END= /DNA_ORIENTATION=
MGCIATTDKGGALKGTTHVPSERGQVDTDWNSLVEDQHVNQGAS